MMAPDDSFGSFLSFFTGAASPEEKVVGQVSTFEPEGDENALIPEEVEEQSRTLPKGSNDSSRRNNDGREDRHNNLQIDDLISIENKRNKLPDSGGAAEVGLVTWAKQQSSEVGVDTEKGTSKLTELLSSIDEDNAHISGRGEGEGGESSSQQKETAPVTKEAKEDKAAARARRKARRERDAKTKSIEAPRMVGYGDESESARFFGVESSTRDLKAPPGDTDKVKCVDTEPSESDNTLEQYQQDKSPDSNEPVRIDVSGGEDKDTSGEVLDPKAAARAKRKAKRERDARLNKKSIEAPRISFGGESERFFGVGPSTRDMNDSGEIDSVNPTNQRDGSEGSSGDEKKDGSPLGLPQCTDSSLGGEDTKSKLQTDDLDKSDTSIGVDDLQRPGVIHSSGSARKLMNSQSDHDGSDASLDISDLRQSYGSRRQLSVESFTSDASLTVDDLNKDDSPKYDSKTSSMPEITRRPANRHNHNTTFGASMPPRRLNRQFSRSDNALRRSQSSGSGEYLGQSKLKELNVEVKMRNSGHRMKRTCVARQANGKLSQSMNSPMNNSMNSSVGSKSSGWAALSDSIKIKGVLGAFQTPLADGPEDDANDSRRKNSSGSKRGLFSFDSLSSSKRSIDDRTSGDDSDSATSSRRLTIESELGSDSSGHGEHSASLSGHRTKTGGTGHRLSSSRHSQLPTIDDSETSKGSNSTVPTPKPRFELPQVIDDNDDHDDEEENGKTPHQSLLSQQWGNLIGWRPFRRYRRRKAHHIEMMEDQFFIPPPEEGTTFFESLYYTFNEAGNDFVIWIYQASFLTVLSLFFCSYYVLVLSFAGILVAMESRTGGRCGLDAYEKWSQSHSYYELAFELSWTTFTTVGYGVIAPSGDDDECYPMRFLCSLFAFMGLLFNSLSAAIFFSKLERVLTRASVTFSSSACLQFGKPARYTRGSTGVYGQFWMKNNSMRSLLSIDTEASSNSNHPTLEANESENSKGRLTRVTLREAATRVINEAKQTVPCPFLEFRIVNDHANYKNRAVRNAHVTAMVQVNANDAECARGLSRRASSGLALREFVAVAKESLEEEEKKKKNGSTAVSVSTNHNRWGKGSLAASIVGGTAMVVQETDASENGKGSGPEGRVYYPMELEPDNHPYFRRVWYIRHTLNEKSPLLKKKVRDKIKKLGGWDAKLNRHQDILASLVGFHRIRLTFKGTSAASNALAFSQKVYTIEDVYIGWQFGQIFYEHKRWMWFRKLMERGSSNKSREDGDDGGGDDDDNLLLDKRLIHDILPQAGGGQEPIEG